MNRIHITVQGPFRKSWRRRKQTRAAFLDVADFVATRAASRVRRSVWWSWVRPAQSAEFQAAAEEVLFGVVVGARYVLQSEPDALFSRRGYQLIREVTDARIHTGAGRDWPGARMVLDNERLKKLLIAAVIAWLRIQFPVLNAGLAGAAVVALSELLKSRNDTKRNQE